MEKLELEKEKEKLSQILEIINKVLKDEQLDLHKLYKDSIDYKRELWRIADTKKLYISNLETSLDQPYFARIDFTAREEGKTSTIYIGNNDIIQGTDKVVTDWRAPVSSLYYGAEVGECSFETPTGEIKGNMSLKRQYEIEAGKLLGYFDIDSVSNDNLLEKNFNNSNVRLKSIVPTIQKEQNSVIRKNIVDNLIIQGPTGSGKTTVALHRIAYLVYNYIKNIKQNQYLIIGPNPLFFKHIKPILPEFNINDVGQYTYEDFAKNYIGEDININSPAKKVTSYISEKSISEVDAFKSSMQYKEMLDRFLKIYFYSITSKPLMLGKFEVLPQEVIARTFESATKGYSNNLNNIIEITMEKLCGLVEEEQVEILHNYNDYSFELFKMAKTETEKNKLRSVFSKDRLEISKNCRSTIRKYFNKSKLNCIKLYKLFISTIVDFDIYNYDKLLQLKQETSKSIRNNTYELEDLPALLYIKSVIAPNKDYEKVRHVVIDEAQDFGEFDFYVMKKTLPNATFSVFGDLAQSTYDYRRIKSWNDVNAVMFDNKGEIIYFNNSYRTTAEIMDVANDVLESIGFNRSETVVRHGENVNISKVSQVAIPEYIAKKIMEYKQKGYRTIAVISKDDLLSNDINDGLNALGLNIPNVTANVDAKSEKFSICTISNQLAKGLEFDAVIINNANEKLYSSNNNLDMRLLYIAITRALHELDIVYAGTLTKLLESSLKRYKARQLLKSK